MAGRTPFETRKKRRKSASDHKSEQDAKKKKKGSNSIGAVFAERGVRETIESVIVAVMLALLFRAFEAEAFVIPTGSMAPTLMGRHKDVQCDKCQHWYRTGASEENDDIPFERRRYVVETTCPICRYSQVVDETEDANEASFSGDRILVNKFAYQVASPRRWDVIVFKYPDNPKQNYIKRLIGLPNEEIVIFNGDIWAAPLGTDDFQIQSKDPRKLLAMLQTVDDTHHIPAELKEVGWPSRWDEWGVPEAQRVWSIDNSGEHPVFRATGPADAPAWLRYRHIAPHFTEWDSDILQGRLPPRLDDFRGALITDYYAYNDQAPVNANYVDLEIANRRRQREQDRSETPDDQDRKENYQKRAATQGLNWVGDLAVEFDINVEGEQGAIHLDLVEGGIHFECVIDVSDGTAKITTSEEALTFLDREGEPVSSLESSTPLRGSGKYRLRYANADNRIYLWVNNKPVKFDGDGKYDRRDMIVPYYSPDEPHDAEPIGLGVRDATVEVTRARVLRDLYYTFHSEFLHNDHDYQLSSIKYKSPNRRTMLPHLIRDMLQSPETWNDPQYQVEDFFRSRFEVADLVTYRLEEDQFFPLGDNSPRSADARGWGEEKYVEGDYLIGKALFVYWPHSWNRPVPFLPNFRRMGFIR